MPELTMQAKKFGSGQSGTNYSRGLTLRFGEWHVENDRQRPRRPPVLARAATSNVQFEGKLIELT